MAYFAPYIDGTGIHMPTYEDRLEDLVSAYRNIFGLDAELSPAFPDYQLLSVFAKALDDTSALAVQAFNSRNPAYATGRALDLLLPQYGLSRAAGETDAEIRKKIRNSLAGRGAGSAEAIVSAVKQKPYVTDAKLYVNDTDSTDAKGIPAHSLCLVTKGGLAGDVAQAIYDKKAPGLGTWGATSGNAVDAQGNTVPIAFTRCTDKICYVYLIVQVLPGGDQSAIQAAVGPAVTEFINSRKISESLVVPQLYGVAYAADPAIADTFVILDIQVSLANQEGVIRDRVPVAWNEKAACMRNGGITWVWEDSL